MARVLRGDRGWGIFPRMELFSVAIGGFGGYWIGYWSTAYEEHALLKKERLVDMIRGKAAKALSEIELHEKKKEEFARSLRDLKEFDEQLKQKVREGKKFYEHLLQKERALRELEQQLAQRERNVKTAERKNS